MDRSRPQGKADAQAGLKEGDVIVAINGQPFKMTPQEFQMHVRLSCKKGDDLKLTVVRNGRTTELALPLAGLMSLESFETVRAGLVDLRAAARALGCTLPEPFLQVAFLPLPVIPHLKITDRGLFDVDAFAFVE